MFFIKKLITPFLLPPGVFVVLSAAAGLFLLKRSKRAALTFFAMAGLIWLSSIAPVSDFLFIGLENAGSAGGDLKADAVVVLCGGIVESVPEVSAGERLTAASLERLSAAAEVYRKARLPIIVSGGSPFSAGSSEAAAGKLYLIECGVPAGEVITEERARDTRESAVLTKEICDEKGYGKILLLTSAYHMRRAMLSFKSAGFAGVRPLPVARVYAPGRRYIFKDYLPGSGKTEKALSEWFGLLFYKAYYR